MNTIETGPADAAARIVLAHGAGAPMDSPFMEKISELLAERALSVVRFEFGYMAGRRTGGKKRPAPKAELLMPEYVAAIEQLAARSGCEGQRLVIGGKSMGGRVASMVADDMLAKGIVHGLVCLGYPFLAMGKPDAVPRIEHLKALRCPALIVQGERDPFGPKAVVEGYPLSRAISFHWVGDGDHDLGPRGGSGFTRRGNLEASADAVAAFAESLGA